MRTREVVSSSTLLARTSRRDARLKIHQRGEQWKQCVVMYMMLYTSLLYNTTPIHCTSLPLHPPVMNTQRHRLRLVHSRVFATVLWSAKGNLTNNIVPCIYIYIYNTMFMCTLYICICIYRERETKQHICICMCIYVYIYIYIYTYTYIYIY